MAFSQTLVTQPYGPGATGTVSFLPDRPMTNGADFAGSGAATVGTLDGSGNLSVLVPSTMDAGTSPQGARMRVHERINGGNRVYYVQIPTSGPVVLGSLARTDDSGAPTGLALPTPAPGGYLFPLSPNSASASGALGNGLLRLSAWVVTARMAIDRIGGDIATIGESGSKLRLGIYADNGLCFPGALVLDAGQIAGDSATLQDLVCSLVLPPGLYWIGGAVQGAPTTQPTVRITSNWFPPVPTVLNSQPAANSSTVGYTQSSVTGALPAVFGGTGNAGSVPRVHVRTA